MEKYPTFYKWVKVKNGILSYAFVTLDVEQNLLNENKICESYSGKGFTSQGRIEDVTEHGYESWKIAAKHGLEFAFSLIDTFWTVNIIEISGRDLLDTNPTVVGYTTILAFFDKINFQLEPEQIKILEDYVFSSWAQIGKELIPNFFNLTFEEYIYKK